MAARPCCPRLAQRRRIHKMAARPWCPRLAQRRRILIVVAMFEAQEEEDAMRGRRQYGSYHDLVKELHLDQARFKAYFRLNKVQFEDLLRRVAPETLKEPTAEPISAHERLCICLWYLATGDSFRSVALIFRVGHGSVARVVRSVCRAVWDVLLPEFMPAPGRAQWGEIARDFRVALDFPNCVGAVDKKHLVVEALPEPSGSSSSMRLNNTTTFSVFLLAVVDARYRFRVVEVGAYERPDGGHGGGTGTLTSSPFGHALHHDTLDLPGDAALPGAERLGALVPHVFIADEAFPLKRNLLRPYPGGGNAVGERKVFNGRLSHARRTVEGAFGMLASRWQLYRRVHGISPPLAETVVRATCMLHNFLQWDNVDDVTPDIPPETSVGMQNSHRLGSNNASREAMAVRERFTQYFVSSAGQVPWQNHF